ncbi:ATP-grasp domain-containing protein [Salinisphaera sp. SPP-AMP-43]|uniref:ATP-grasp domain-containing protein n=1 Tax=Salinisphaera sp. SPP-AMP-43 TaxID=3121288 RepID=UPI003C6DC4EF
MKNVFVVGLDAFNRDLLEALPEAREVRFHALLDFDEVRGRNDYPVEVLLARCQERLSCFEGSVDGFLGFLDFPVTLILPLLCRRYGLPGPSFDAVMRCEHKLWSRLLQKQVVPENVPYFAGFDPYRRRPLEGLELQPPFWIKPVKSFRSYLAFRIDGRASLAAALYDMRRNVKRLAEPFERLVDRVQLPPELAGRRNIIGIAEQALAGHQCTVEGYVYQGEVTVYGVVDSIQSDHASSFQRYEYPSGLPRSVHIRMAEVCQRLMPHLAYDHGTFNAEFFYDPLEDRLGLLEINPRHSQSHAYLFKQLHGVANHQVAVQLALGRKPCLPEIAPDGGVAAKFMLRSWHDAFITRVPGLGERAALIERWPNAHLEVLVQPGQRLSNLAAQDSYSFELADLYLSAQNSEALERAYREIVAGLTFRCAQETDLEMPM